MVASRVKKKAKPEASTPLNSPSDSVADASKTPCLIVGLGASAGGIAAFEAFFSAMPADSGMAFVLVQHLSPDHHSILAELIQHKTSMPVFQVKDGTEVKNNCVYVIPPNRDLALLNGRLQLLVPVNPRGHPLAIDLFFKSLAQDQRERAIGIVLSGTGSDGTLGLQAIKNEGGMIMAQSSESSEYKGMPNCAISTGLVDFVLPPAEMPAALISYAAHAFESVRKHASVPTSKAETALQKIFVLLRAQTSHDFSQYKSSTIRRRIERRMAVQQIDALDHYVKYLQQTPAEVDALFRDLLIGVTQFFRDSLAYAALEQQIIAKLFDNKPAGGEIRVWSAGCASGEEAYSIAILLQECLEKRNQPYSVKVFGSDIDSLAIAKARAGLYPTGIAADISPQRLGRFFTAEPDGSGYRINKTIRDLVVFAEQDVIKDPPFSRLDLISCRNLLIYLDAPLQQKLMTMFHFALKPGGTLFLGSSSSAGDYAELFIVVDRKAKLYQRRVDSPGLQPKALSRFLPPDMVTMQAHQASNMTSPAKLPCRELTEQTLLQFAPACALVNNRGEILYLHGRMGMYLEMASGEIRVNILNMAREGLKHDLVTALSKAVHTHERVHRAGLRVKLDGLDSTVNLTIIPVANNSATPHQMSLYLVTLEETLSVIPQPAPLTELPDSAISHVVEPELKAMLEVYRQEMRAKDEYLLATCEELETSNEELKCFNEEMQSMNEEMQSTNEELETSKEELQSVNEELTTVNSELESKLRALSQANNDMVNLLAGTGIATVFVDHSLCILRFTPSAREIINLIPSDMGRPLADLVSNLQDYDNLVVDAQAVLHNLIPKEAEVQTKQNKWYKLNIQPYRTSDNKIEGAVITFVDITEMVNIREALLKANQQQRLAIVVRDAHDAITVQDLDGLILAWNPGAVRLYGWSEAEALLLNVRDRIPPALRDDALEKLQQLSQAEILEPYHSQRLAADGAVISVSIIATALLDETGRMYAIATTERQLAGGGK
jgi:two-component system CheB/CheR fusion protein